MKGSYSFSFQRIGYYTWKKGPAKSSVFKIVMEGGNRKSQVFVNVWIHQPIFSRKYQVDPYEMQMVRIGRGNGKTDEIKVYGASFTAFCIMELKCEVKNLEPIELCVIKTGPQWEVRPYFVQKLVKKNPIPCQTSKKT